MLERALSRPGHFWTFEACWDRTTRIQALLTMKAATLAQQTSHTYAEPQFAGNIQVCSSRTFRSHRTSFGSSSEKRSADTSALRSRTEHTLNHFLSSLFT